MKKSIIIASIVIVLALVGGGVFWYVKQGNKEADNTPVKMDETEQITTDTQDTTVENNENILKKDGVDENGWNIYQSEEYGFEVRVPENWKIDRYGEDVYYGQYVSFYYVNNMLSSNENFAIYIIGNDQKIIVNNKEDFLNYNKIYAGALRSFEIIQEDNYTIIKTKEASGPGDIFSIIYYVFSDKYIYSFVTDYDKDNIKKEDNFYNIVKTFKFLKFDK